MPSLDQQAAPAPGGVPAHFYLAAPMDGHQQRRHAAVLAMLDGLTGSVLDYGCGFGDLTWALARAQGQAVGVDVNPERIAFARSQYAPLEFHVCREDGLDFADASFDMVASVVVVPFVPDVDAYLNEVSRVLRPGGHLVIATRSASWLHRVHRRFRGRTKDRPMPAKVGVKTRKATDISPAIQSRLHHHSARVAEAKLAQHGFQILARSAIYDPPFTGFREGFSFAESVVDIVSERLHWYEAAQYPLFLARRV